MNIPFSGFTIMLSHVLAMTFGKLRKTIDMGICPDPLDPARVLRDNTQTDLVKRSNTHGKSVPD